LKKKQVVVGVAFYYEFSRVELSAAYGGAQFNN
jgi:hypothetical protein